MTEPDRLRVVLELIDEANKADPNLEEVDGCMQPAALLYGRRMSAVLNEFAPIATCSEAIAVRAQHIERWLRPRGDYPQGRAGYLAWRRDAGRYHARRVAELMSEAGYDNAACARVSTIVSKRGIKSDMETQTLEDVACLVFMRWYFLPFAQERLHEDVYRIVAKTARKMSPAGRHAALSLPIPAQLVPALTGADSHAASR